MENHHSKRQTIYKWRTFQSNLEPGQPVELMSIKNAWMKVQGEKGFYPNLLINPIDGQMLSSCQNLLVTQCYPLVNKHNYGKSPCLMVQSTISMAMFNSFL